MAETETAAGRGGASAGRQQAGALSVEDEPEGASPPGQQAWLGAAASAHRGAAHEKDRAAASNKPNALRVITKAYHATQLLARLRINSRKM